VISRGRPHASVPARDNSESMQRCRVQSLLRDLLAVQALAEARKGDSDLRLAEVGPQVGWASRRGRLRTSDTSSTD